ncbi:MAG: hypothetical protein LBR54_01790 [Oscillospiraceae bacterium]|jgi:hypothetical protein|nr:hypothetical protein [Oscillospiraceae bacterium]
MELLLIAAVFLIVIFFFGYSILVKLHVPDDIVVILPIYKNQQAEDKIRRLIRFLKWNGGKVNPKIYLLNKDNDKDTLEICKKLCEEKHCVRMVKPRTVD